MFQWNTVLMTIVDLFLQCQSQHRSNLSIQQALLAVQSERKQILVAIKEGCVRHFGWDPWKCYFLFTSVYLLVWCLQITWINADSTNGSTINREKASSSRPGRKTMEMETKPSSMDFTVQMEVAKTLEVVRVDQTQRWNNHEGKTKVSNTCSSRHDLSKPVRHCSIFTKEITMTISRIEPVRTQVKANYLLVAYLLNKIRYQININALHFPPLHGAKFWSSMPSVNGIYKPYGCFCFFGGKHPEAEWEDKLELGSPDAYCLVQFKHGWCV